MRAARAFTIAETLVVAVILGMMLTGVAAAFTPLFSAPDRAQAKTDSLNGASAGLYLLERDLRQGDAYGIFACAGEPDACGDGVLAMTDSAVAIVTALDSSDLGAHFQTNGSGPEWSGFIVYWQRAPGGDVYRSFEPMTLMTAGAQLNAADRPRLELLAQEAVDMAGRETAPAIAMHRVQLLNAIIQDNVRITTLHVVSYGAVGGYANTTTFDDDIFARN